MLTKLVTEIISLYVHTSNHSVVRWKPVQYYMSGYLKKTGGGGKDSTGETGSCMSLPTVLGDKFWPCDQSCDMVPHIGTKISYCDIKFVFFK